MPRPEEYKAIKAWGQLLRSFAPFIRSQQELAAKENAPVDAIYRKMDQDGGQWVTVGEISDPATLHTMRRRLGEIDETV